MKPILDLTKEYSLVLDGGGARGAYQIGAWKALVEAGVKINAPFKAPTDVPAMALIFTPASLSAFHAPI